MKRAATVAPGGTSKSAPAPGNGDWPLGAMEEAIRAVAARSKGGAKRAPFPRMLRQHFAWFHAQHEEYGLTWEGWVEVLRGCGFTGRGGIPLTARAARAAYQREKALREAGVQKESPGEREAPNPAMAEAVQEQAPRRLQRLTGAVE